MPTGAHVVIYSKDAAADRAFFRDILGFRSVDAGHGWLIFGVPAAEVAFHTHDQNNKHEMYFICDDLKAEKGESGKEGGALWRNIGRAVGDSHDDFAPGRGPSRPV